MAAMNLYASQSKDNVMVYKSEKQREKTTNFVVIAFNKLRSTSDGIFRMDTKMLPCNNIDGL